MRCIVFSLRPHVLVHRPCLLVSNIMDFSVILKHAKRTFISEHLYFPYSLPGMLFIQVASQVAQLMLLPQRSLSFPGNCPFYHHHLRPDIPPYCFLYHDVPRTIVLFIWECPEPRMYAWHIASAQ